MALFSGKIGYIEQVEQPGFPGNFVDSAIERDVTGKLISDRMRYESGETQSDSLNITNKISIMAGSYTINNVHRMRYIVIRDVRWDISSFEFVGSRILLTVGGLYNGPIPIPSEES